MGSFIYKMIATDGISIFDMVFMFDTQKCCFPLHSGCCKEADSQKRYGLHY